ncbi:ribosome small subunit-dependent GTPase A [Cellulomonas sp. SG140]|uniref:ribosome small subunit-dependent GTPase A n=1 Tax=Cellulomonas sp. SG140 TaxID=2976536 RepID=UPI0021E8091B|nr:ribosome small subunit-dependent GTPase A [Cellulomonas sp. SG140]
MDTVRVVRADRGAVLVVPADVPQRPTDQGHRGADQALDTVDAAAPVRVPLDHDGLVPDPDGLRLPPTVGDVLVLDASAPGDQPHVHHLVPRRTALVRDTAGATSREQVLAANVDVVLVVEHLDPDPSLGRVERLLTLAWRSGAQPVVVLTKSDLVPDAPSMAAEVASVAPGAPVHAVSVVDGSGLDGLRALLRPGTTLVMVGPSGAGKSSLVNALAGHQVMETGERRADGRGRHTTTHRELVPLGDGVLLIDTPGVRGIGLVADAEALDETFADVTALAADCRFADCAHLSEPGCAVLAAVEDGELPERRLESWRRLAREAAHQARRADARLAAQERARVRQWSRDVHRSLRERDRVEGRGTGRR